MSSPENMVDVFDLPLLDDGPEADDGAVKWIPTNELNEYYGPEYRCPKCGTYTIGTPNYCDNCGARMDGQVLEFYNPELAYGEL